MTETKRRGRPKRSHAQAADRRKDIINIARSLFHENGFTAVSMRKIAAEAGMSPMSIYQYFDGKTEILHHIWAESFDAALVNMQVAFETAENPRAGYKASVHAYVRYFIDHPDQFRMIFLNEDRADSNDRFFVDHSDMDARLRQIFAPWYDDAMAGKSAEEIEMFEQGVYSFTHGLLLNVISISEYDWRPAEKLLDRYLDMVLVSQSL